MILAAHTDVAPKELIPECQVCIILLLDLLGFISLYYYPGQRLPWPTAEDNTVAGGLQEQTYIKDRRII